MATKRQRQIEEDVRQLLSLTLVRGEVGDPRVAGVNILSVKITPDLQTAKIYFSHMSGRESEKSALKGLQSASGYLRKLISEQLRLRLVPVLAFYYDDSAEYSVHMSALLDKVSRESSTPDGENESDK